MRIKATVEAEHVVDLFAADSPMAPVDALDLDVDPAILGADSLDDYSVVGDALVLDPGRIADRQARELRRELHHDLRQRLKAKIMAALEVDNDGELMLVLPTAPQTVQGRIARVRARLRAKDAELEQLDLAQLQAFDPETEIDWS